MTDSANSLSFACLDYWAWKAGGVGNAFTRMDEVGEEGKELQERPPPEPFSVTCITYTNSCYHLIRIFFRWIFYASWNFCKTNRALLLGLLLGQILSLLLSGGGVSCEALEKFQGVTAPTTQLFLSYLLIAFVFGIVLACKDGFLKTLWEHWWKYAILGVIDAEANFLAVLAYRYTNLTSIQLLDSFTIIAVVILSFIFLRVRYLILHIVAVALCMIGIIALVLADLETISHNSESNPLLGDLLCIMASVLYATSNVSQEYLVKRRSMFEWLALIGVSGSIVTGIQLSILDRATLVRIDWSDWKTGVLFSAFSISQFGFYALMPLMLRLTSAVVLNLSLLTADIYTLAFGYFLFKYHFSLFYLVAFTLIITGVFIFNLKAPPVAKPRRKKRTNRSAGTGELNHADKGKKEVQDLKSSQDSQAMRPISAKGVATAVSATVSVPKHHSALREEQRGILVRGPAEAALSSHSYTTSYSQSMSYSYGSTDPSPNSSPKDSEPIFHGAKSMSNNR